MIVRSIASYVVGVWVFLQDPRARDERGLSQSVETVILLVGAIAVAGFLVGAVTVYVKSHLPD